RRRPAARGRRARQGRLRRAARPVVPRGSPAGGRRPPPLARPRPLPPQRARAPAPRAHRAQRRPRAPSVVPVHARALATELRGRMRGRLPYVAVVAAALLPRAVVL